MPLSLKTVQHGADALAKWLLVSVFATFPTTLALTNLLTAMTVLAWLAAADFSNRWQAVKNNPVTWFLLSLYGLILLHSLFTPAQASQIGQHLNKYSKLLVCLVFMSLLTEAKWVKRCGIAFVAAMLFILASAYVNIWVDLPWSKTKNQGFGQDHTVFGDYITQNIMMAFFVLLCLVRFQASPLAWARRLWLGLALVASFSVVALSEGRTGFVLLCLLVLVFFLYTPVIPWRLSYKIMGCFVIAIGLLAAMHASPLMKQRFEQAYAEAKSFESHVDTAVGVRVYIMKQSLELIAARPILGHGTASYHDLICTVMPARKKCHISEQHPDNQYILLGVDHGVLGVALFMGLILAVFMMAMKQPIELKILMLGFAAMLFLNSFVSSSLWTSRQNHFFMFVLAWLAAQAHSHLKAKKACEPIVA